MVLEIPPADGGSITGSVDDCWKMAIEDVGPAGVDKGRGGEYLILPPGYNGQVRAVSSPCRRRPTKGMRSFAPTCRAALKRMWLRQSLTAGG
jgi:hypothetical protein